jgi:hypothetical protein
MGWLRPNLKQVGACISITLALLYIGFKVQLHAIAMNKIASLPRPRVIEKYAALPQINPRQWNSVFYARTGAASELLNVSNGFGDDIAPELKSSPPSEITVRASEARSAAVLLSFARFPVTQVHELPSGYRVLFIDFSFYRETTNTALASEVILDKSLRVVSEDLAFVRRIN